MQKLFQSLQGAPKNPMIGKSIQIQHKCVRVQRQIGEGGFSCIYEVVDVGTGDVYALKHLRLGAEQDLIKEIQHEGLVMAKLRNHPNILRLHAMAFAGSPGRETDGFMLLDYCPKTLLDMMSAANFNLDAFFIYEVFSEVCQAVLFMHSQNPPLAHRDLKAENVLKNSAGRWVLCDFGSATTRAQVYESPAEIATEEDNVRRTTTPAYRAPEMWDLMTRQRIDTKVDIWALGVLLYVLVYGKLPFDGESKLSILFGKYTLPPGKPPVLVALIKDLLHTDPEQRPDIQQVIARLKSVKDTLAQDALSAPPSPPPPAFAAAAGAPNPAAVPRVPPGTRFPSAVAVAAATHQISPALLPSAAAAPQPVPPAAAAAAAAAAANRQATGELISTSPPRQSTNASTAAWPAKGLPNGVAPGTPPTSVPPTAAVPPTSGPSSPVPPGGAPYPAQAYMGPRPAYPPVPPAPGGLHPQQQQQLQVQQIQQQQLQQQRLHALNLQSKPMAPLSPTMGAPPTPGYPTLPPARVERSANSSQGFSTSNPSPSMSHASSASSLRQMNAPPQQQQQQPVARSGGSFTSAQPQGPPVSAGLSPALQAGLHSHPQQQQQQRHATSSPSLSQAPSGSAQQQQQQQQQALFEPDWGEEPAFGGGASDSGAAPQRTPTSGPAPTPAPAQAPAAAPKPAGQPPQQAPLNRASAPLNRASPPLSSPGQLPKAASPTTVPARSDSPASAPSRSSSNVSQAPSLGRVSADPTSQQPQPQQPQPQQQQAAAARPASSTAGGAPQQAQHAQHAQQAQQMERAASSSLRAAAEQQQALSKAVQEEQAQRASEAGQLRESLQGMTSSHQALATRVQQLEEGQAEGLRLLRARVEQLEEAGANQVNIFARLNQLEALAESQAQTLQAQAATIQQLQERRSGSASSSSSSSSSSSYRAQMQESDSVAEPERASSLQSGAPEGPVPAEMGVSEAADAGLVGGAALEGGGASAIPMPEDHHW